MSAEPTEELREALARWRATALLLSIALVLLSATVAITWRKAAAFDSLILEHLELQSRLQRLDHKMSEVDRILLRLRLYDAQLESLGDPKGDAGPLPPDVWANKALPRDLPPDELAPEEEAHGEPLESLRPASAWAEAVEARATTFLSSFEAREPDLARFVSELEELGAIERSLPSLLPARAVLTSGYGWRRNPLGRRFAFHAGIDLGGAIGDPIYASAQGKVVTASVSGGYGRYVEIDHGYGIVTLYAHCSRLLVAEGDVVRRGQKIGLMGNTGRSTGPHLHFEVHLDGTPVDPMDYLRRARRPPVEPSPRPPTP